MLVVPSGVWVAVVVPAVVVGTDFIVVVADADVVADLCGLEVAEDVEVVWVLLLDEAAAFFAVLLALSVVIELEAVLVPC